MIELTDITDLPRPKQVDIFTSRINRSFQQAPIIKILSIFTAYKLKDELYKKFFEGYETEDIIERLNFELTETYFDEKDIAWNVVIDTLGEAMIFNIIDNIKVYMEAYLKLTEALSYTRKTMFELYVKVGIKNTNYDNQIS